MRKYLFALVAAFAAFVPVFLAAALAAGLVVSNAFEPIYKQRYQNQKSTYYHKYDGGIPIDNYTLLGRLGSCRKQKNIITLGTSTTREGVLEDKLDLAGGYKFINFSIPSQGINELYMMLDFINQFSPHKPDKTDWIKIDISVAFFKKRPADESIFAQTAENGRVYRADRENLTVSRGAGSGFVFWQFLKLQSLIDECRASIKNKPITVEPYKESMFKRYKELWTRNLDDFDLSSLEQERFFAALEPLTGQTNVAVEAIYGGSWLYDTKQGKQYLQWIDDVLKPRLDQMSIAFLDTGAAIEDAYYAEQSHLNYEGRVKYTELENELLNQLTGS